MQRKVYFSPCIGACLFVLASCSETSSPQVSPSADARNTASSGRGDTPPAEAGEKGSAAEQVLGRWQFRSRIVDGMDLGPGDAEFTRDIFTLNLGSGDP